MGYSRQARYHSVSSSEAETASGFAVALGQSNRTICFGALFARFRIALPLPFPTRRTCLSLRLPAQRAKTWWLAWLIIPM